MVTELVEIVTGLIDNLAGRNRVDLVDEFAYRSQSRLSAGCSGCPARTNHASACGPPPSSTPATPPQATSPPADAGASNPFA